MPGCFSCRFGFCAAGDIVLFPMVFVVFFVCKKQGFADLRVLRGVLDFQIRFFGGDGLRAERVIEAMDV